MVYQIVIINQVRSFLLALRVKERFIRNYFDSFYVAVFFVLIVFHYFSFDYFQSLMPNNCYFLSAANTYILIKRSQIAVFNGGFSRHVSKDKYCSVCRQ